MATRKSDLIRDIVVAIQDEQTQQAFFSNAIAERLDVTSTELEVLGTLVARGPLSASDIAARTGLTSGAVTRLIDRLEQRGSVRRRADANDRRRVLVEITPSAQHVCEPFYGPLAREGTALLEECTQQELETILRYLQTSYALAKKHTERVSLMPERPYLPKRKVNIKGRVLGQTIRIKI
ncbi:MAG TPA: MarR family transcriptional regulator [Candidatus Acidoferrales bacterium]|nr:MarR family transcriptional regulator [Candidatus Acidoferrales bacterium]